MYWRNKQPAGSDCAAGRVLYARAYVIDVLIKHTCVPFCLLGSGRVHAQLIGHGRPALDRSGSGRDVHDRFPTQLSLQTTMYNCMEYLH